MAKKTPGTGTWLGLASEPRHGSDGAIVSGYRGGSWSYAPVGRRGPSSDTASGPLSVVAAPDRAASPAPDSVAGSSPASLEAPASNPASAGQPAPAPAAGSTSVPPSGNQNIDGVLAGVKWTGPITFS